MLEKHIPTEAKASQKNTDWLMVNVDGNIRIARPKLQSAVGRRKIVKKDPRDQKPSWKRSRTV